jgi:hypothetical protein
VHSQTPHRAQKTATFASSRPHIQHLRSSKAASQSDRSSRSSFTLLETAPVASSDPRPSQLMVLVASSVLSFGDNRTRKINIASRDPTPNKTTIRFVPTDVVFF